MPSYKLSFTDRLKIAAFRVADAVKSLFSTTTIQFSQWSRGLGFSGYSYVKLAEMALKNPYASRALWVVAWSMSQVPIHVYRMDRQGKTEEDDAHPASMLLQRPGKRLSRFLLFLQMVYQAYLAGEFWLWIGTRKSTSSTGRAGDPVMMKLLRPDRFVEFVYADDSEEEIVGYKFKKKKGYGTVVYSTDEVMHWHNFHPADMDRGLPILISALRALEIQENADAWNLSISAQRGQIPVYFRRTGGAASGPFSGPDAGVSEEHIDHLNERLVSRWQRLTRQSKPMVVNDGYEIDSAAVNPQEAQWLEGDTMAGRKIAIAAGVDPALLGDAANKTYSNLETALRALFVLTSLPLLDWILDELNGWLMPKWVGSGRTGRWLGYDRDEIEALQEDITAKYERLIKGVEAGVVKIDEARGLLTFDELGGAADRLYTNFNRVPLDTIGGEATEAEERELALRRQQGRDTEPPGKRNGRSKASGDGSPSSIEELSASIRALTEDELGSVIYENLGIELK